MKPGDQIELKVTPDPYVTYRYAGASLDFNPIHIDEDFAKRVGLPGRILHGLWTMAQVARAVTEGAGGPGKLKELKVEFRGMGQLGEEITVSGEVQAASEASNLTANLEAVQAGKRIIRNGLATFSSD